MKKLIFSTSMSLYVGKDTRQGHGMPIGTRM